MARELEVLFNSKAMPKILNLFFQNEERGFRVKEVAKRCQIHSKTVKKELEKLRKISLLQRKSQKNKYFYLLNPKFPFLNELRAMIVHGSPLSLKELSYILKRIRGIRLAVVSGIFLKGRRTSSVDLLIVGDKIQKAVLSRAIRRIESQMGKEINWCLMTTEEFKYRIEMNDKFLRDIFDFTHKKIIDKLNI